MKLDVGGSKEGFLKTGELTTYLYVDEKSLERDDDAYLVYYPGLCVKCSKASHIYFFQYYFSLFLPSFLL